MILKIYEDEEIGFLDSYLKSFDEALFFYSEKFRSLLANFLEDSKSIYFAAFDEEDKAVAILPAFLKDNKKYGKVLNSLPFFGSNGGIFSFEENIEAKLLLIRSFEKFAKENCISSTLITSPFEKDVDFYRENMDYDFEDYRIGQITFLDEAKEKENLMDFFISKLKNKIKKAIKNGVNVYVDNSEKAFSFLMETHQENIKELGGVYKEKPFFDSVRKKLAAGKDFNLYIAEMNNVQVAALLIFYFNRVVEYYTPAIKKEYRTYQPLSLIIFEAMNKAVKEGYKYWNWGGTWKTQDGVYKFKERWKAKDLQYYYFIKIYDKNIMSLNSNEAKREFKYYYLFPFNKVGGSE